MRRFACLVLIGLLIASCARARRYELEGQVLAVDPVKGELTVRHKDIKGFMPAMTMPFKVVDKAVLAERKPGDMIKATLVVSESTGRLADVVKIGEAPLPADAPTPGGMNVLEPGAEIPDARLVDQDGRERRVSEWRGRTLAVTFVYTRCPVPDFCPLIDRNFAAVQEAVSRDPAASKRIHLLSVSFDPDFDKPEVLRAHAKRVGTNRSVWTWLTGDRESVDRFASAFGVAVLRGDQPAQEIVHNLRTAVVDREGRLVKILDGNEWRPEDLLAEIRAADAR